MRIIKALAVALGVVLNPTTSPAEQFFYCVAEARADGSNAIVVTEIGKCEDGEGSAESTYEEFRQHAAEAGLYPVGCEGFIMRGAAQADRESLNYSETIPAPKCTKWDF